MPEIGLWARMDPKNHVLDGGPEALGDVAMATIFFGFLYANTTEPSVCGGDAASCQITLVTCFSSSIHAGRHRCHVSSKKGCNEGSLNLYTTRMWANAQRDGRPAEYSWRPLFNAAKFG